MTLKSRVVSTMIKIVITAVSISTVRIRVVPSQILFRAGIICTLFPCRDHHSLISGAICASQWRQRHEVFVFELAAKGHTTVVHRSVKVLLNHEFIPLTLCMQVLVEKSEG